MFSGHVPLRIRKKAVILRLANYSCKPNEVLIISQKVVYLYFRKHWDACYVFCLLPTICLQLVISTSLMSSELGGEQTTIQWNKY